jgi:hypothetical protein
MDLAYTTTRPPCTIRPNARVLAIYATVPNPYTDQPQRVRVLEVRTVNILSQGGEPPYQVVEVCDPSPQCLPFSVRRELVTNLSFFTVEELK